MIKQKGLQQMRSVNFNWNLAKKARQRIVSNAILKQRVCHLSRIVQVEAVNSLFGKSVALEWVQAIWRLGYIIDDHDGVSEVSIGRNHAQ